ncbi:MAG: MocR-like pyridoxine biosynthesis transcription factor PdxR [Pseudonocardia sp.]
MFQQIQFRASGRYHVQPRSNPALPLATTPAYRQLYERIREAILSGQLQAGARLPATRPLAAEAGVSRNTVLAAFDQLAAEGYVEARRGSGTYVARLLPEQMFSPARAVRTGPTSGARPSGLSRRGRSMADAPRMPLPAITGVSARATAFQIGLPALDEFPVELWTRAYTARLRRSTRDLMRYDDAAGYRPLREAIATHVATSRGIRCTADQVVVVAGSQQALEFCARILLDPDDPAWIEDPGYVGARAALTSAGARLVPVPVDDNGLDVAAGVDRAPSARMVIVTPSHQFPLGATMTLDRRLALIDWAARTGAWVVEDDYDSEFHYRGRPLAALQAIDQHQRVIYVGTFSKTMFPGMRLGYLIAPAELVDGFTAAHLSTDVHAHLLDQAVLSDFIRDGHFLRHLRRMRILYRERQVILVRESQRLRERLRIEASDGGLHVVGWLPEHLDDRDVAADAARYGVHAWPLSLHCIEPNLPPALLFGYAATTERDIREGITALDRVLRSAAEHDPEDRCGDGREQAQSAEDGQARRGAGAQMKVGRRTGDGHEHHLDDQRRAVRAAAEAGPGDVGQTRTDEHRVRGPGDQVEPPGGGARDVPAEPA